MKKFTFVFLGLITLVACEAELETENANSFGEANGLTRSGLTISPEEAAAQAIEFRNSLVQGNGLTRSSNQDKAVASVYAWRSSDIAPKASTRSTASDLLPDTLLYIVNFEDSCGYALVSADALVPGVAAYVEKGTLTPGEEIDNPGFKIFLEGYGKFVGDSIKCLKDSLAKYQRLDSLCPVLDSTHVPNTPYSLIYYVAPLLTTEWGQSIPYNLYCPGYKLAGCTAIAIAQISAFYRYPLSYNNHVYEWNKMLQESKINNSIDSIRYSAAQLIYDIAELVYTRYGYNVSTAYFSNVPHCWDEFGYHYDELRDVNFETIKADISNGNPVFMRGCVPGENTGHAWAVDGVALKRHRFALIQSIPDREYIHCNWGWNGDCNGYFILGAFEKRYGLETDYGVSGYRAYNEDIWIYHNIYPIIN